MLKIINELKNNYIFMAAVISWASAQGLKTIKNFLFTKNLKVERLVG